MDNTHMNLGLSVNALGSHIAAWRLDSARTESTRDIDHYVRIAQLAEHSKLDFLFFADSLALDYATNSEGLRRIAQTAHLAPMVLLPALAMVTKNIGLIATASTTYNEPYHLARIVATIDQISRGRAGWNLVTSINQTEAQNFSREAHLDHSTRYQRAAEFARVVMGLWDGWEDGALLYDKAKGLTLDVEKLHFLNHKGEFFQVKGPTDIARSPQGRPVISEAGSSEPGRQLAAETADIVFTAQPNIESAMEFYKDVKDRTVRAGRLASDVRILSGLVPYVGATREEAEAKRQQLNEMIHPEAGLSMLTELVGDFDLRAYPLDGPFPEISETNAGQGRLKILSDVARKQNLTLRQLISWASSRGHMTLCGTAVEIVDEMESWFRSGACDGFMLSIPFVPEGVEDVMEQIVPELQNRGLLRREYEGSTLRENLGVSRPENAFAVGRERQSESA